MRRYIWLIAFFICLCMNAYGQKEHFLSIKSGAGIGKIRDRMISPLIYTGVQVPSEFAYIQETDTSKRELNIAFTWGSLKPAINPVFTDSRMQRYKMQANFNSFDKVTNWSNSRFSIFLGGSWNNLLTFRDNSFAGMTFGEFTSNVSFKPQVNYDLKVLGHDFNLSYNIGIPFLTFMVRSSYAASPPIAFQKDNDDRGYIAKAYESGTLLRPFQFLRFNSRLQGSYYLENKNYISVTYGFDYYHYSEPELVESVSHAFMLGTAFNF